MVDKSILLDKVAIVYFISDDNYIVRSECTANKLIVESNGMIYEQGYLYDLEVHKKVPLSYFSYKCNIFSKEEDIDKRTKLDKFIEQFVKRLW